MLKLVWGIASVIALFVVGLLVALAAANWEFLTQAPSGSGWWWSGCWRPPGCWYRRRCSGDGSLDFLPQR
jgi:hypothetical protein